MLKTMTAALASLFLLGCDPMDSKEVDTAYTGPDYITGPTLEARSVSVLDTQDDHGFGTFYTLTYETNLEEVEVIAGRGLYLFSESQLGTFSDGSYTGALYDFEEDENQPYIGAYENVKTYEVDVDGAFVVVLYFDSFSIGWENVEGETFSCDDPLAYTQSSAISLGGGLLETTFFLDVEINCA